MVRFKDPPDDEEETQRGARREDASGFEAVLRRVWGLPMAAAERLMG